MLKHVRRHATYANIVATLCLISVVSGTAWAAATITGSQIKNNTITGKDVKNRSLTGSDIKSGVIPSYSAGDGLVKSGSQFSGKGTPYARVVVVAKSGGDYTSVQSAINSITDEADDKRYLVWVAPGTYTERVTTAAYIDVAGSGESTTTIQSTAGASASAGAVVTVGGTGTIRDLTISNRDAGGTHAVGLYALNKDAFTVRDVTIDVHEGTTQSDGIYLDASGGTYKHVTVTTGNEAEALAHGINLENGADAELIDSDVTAEGLSCYGTRQNGSTSLTLTRSDVLCTGSTSATGVGLVDGSGARLVDTSVMATNGLAAGDATGLNAETGAGSFSLQNTKIVGLSGPAGTGQGVALGGVSATLSVNASQLIGNTTGVNLMAASTEVSIGGSLLIGGVSGAGLGSATVACAASWDGGFTALNASCA